MSTTKVNNVSAEKAVATSEALFNEDITTLSAADIINSLRDVEQFNLDNQDYLLLDLLVDNKIVTSKREAREFIVSGSITINGDKILDENEIVSHNYAIENKILIIRKGKKKYFMGKFV